MLILSQGLKSVLQMLKINVKNIIFEFFIIFSLKVSKEQVKLEIE